MPSRDFETMFPEIQEDDLVISQSTISSLELSPCRWLYKPEGRNPSEPMFFGTVEHAIIEKYIVGEIDQWALISPQNAWDVALECAVDEGIDLFSLLDGP